VVNGDTLHGRLLADWRPSSHQSLQFVMIARIATSSSDDDSCDVKTSGAVNHCPSPLHRLVVGKIHSRAIRASSGVGLCEGKVREVWR